jgi:hypothetical protein
VLNCVQEMKAEVGCCPKFEFPAPLSDLASCASASFFCLPVNVQILHRVDRDTAIHGLQAGCQWHFAECVQPETGSYAAGKPAKNYDENQISY